jgi:hypothetical protein
MDLSTRSMKGAASWIGVGLGTAGAGTMGPAEFFTGQGNTLVVTDRYLLTGVGYPPANNVSDLTASSCALSGSSSSVLNCSFSRPLQTTAADEVSGPYYVWDVLIAGSCACGRGGGGAGAANVDESTTINAQ